MFQPFLTSPSTLWAPAPGNAFGPLVPDTQDPHLPSDTHSQIQPLTVTPMYSDILTQAQTLTFTHTHALTQIHTSYAPPTVTGTHLAFCLWNGVTAFPKGNFFSFSS